MRLQKLHMSDITSSTDRRLRQRSNGLWSRLQRALLQDSSPQGDRRTSPSWEAFSERFDRCFRRVSFYVSRRVNNDRESMERIVTDVFSENLDLFITPCDEWEEMKRLKASADRLLTAIRHDACIVSCMTLRQR